VEDPPLLNRRLFLLGQDFRELRQRGQRRPELVGHGRDEVGLQAGGGQLARDRAADQVADRDNEQCERAQACDDQPAALGEAA
jgi:hypothetical protein